MRFTQPLCAYEPELREDLLTSNSCKYRRDKILFVKEVTIKHLTSPWASLYHIVQLWMTVKCIVKYSQSKTYKYLLIYLHNFKYTNTVVMQMSGRE